MMNPLNVIKTSGSSIEDISLTTLEESYYCRKILLEENTKLPKRTFKMIIVFTTTSDFLVSLEATGM